MPSTLPPPRRIVTTNLPLPALLTSLKHPEPAVQVLSEDVVQRAEFEGNAYRGTVFTHESIPTSNDGTDVAPKEVTSHGIVLPKGVNIRYNDVGPGQVIPMHRTQSTDYNIILSGTIHLLTPKEAGDGDALGELEETICRPGDVVLQRGTLHAWENRSNEWVRWIVLLLGAEPTMVDVEGKPEKLQLKDFFGQYGGDEIWESL